MHELAWVLISAAMAAVVRLVPTHLYMLSFVYFVPLFYGALTTFRRYGPLQGFVWGLLFFGVYHYGLYWLFYEHAHGAWRMLWGILFTFYCAGYSACWFVLARFLTKYMHRAFAWVIATWCYGIAIEKMLFVPFGRCVGDPLALPLVPLMQAPCFLGLMPTFGIYGYVGVLIALQMSIALLLTTKNLKYGIASAVCIVPFVCGFFLEREQEATQTFEHITVVSPPTCANVYERAQELMALLRVVEQQHPEAVLFLLPESTFTVPLNEYRECVTMWHQHGLLHGKTVILGAHRRDNEKLYNSCWMVRDGQLTLLYDKQEPMLLTETVPSYLVAWGLDELFLYNKRRHITPSTNARSTFTAGGITWMPVICSELFYMHTVPVPPGVCLLALVNDSWFSCEYMQELMALRGALQVMVHGVEGVYVGHTRTYLIRSLCINQTICCF